MQFVPVVLVPSSLSSASFLPMPVWKLRFYACEIERKIVMLMTWCLLDWLMRSICEQRSSRKRGLAVVEECITS